MSRLTKVSLVGLALILAIALALLSVFVERVGPELAQYGDSDNKPVLKGGFPFAYLFDAPGISVERQLAFVEDKLFAGVLILDIAIYFAIVLLTILVVSRRRSARKQAASCVRT
jgi:apolipoprotein N-acyltransferase